MAAHATDFLVSNVNVLLLEGLSFPKKKRKESRSDSGSGTSLNSVKSQGSGNVEKVKIKRFHSFRKSFRLHTVLKRSKSSDNNVGRYLLFQIV